MEQSPSCEEAARAFLGGKFDYYSERWRRFSESPRKVLSFNLAACVGQPVWLAYRKLYAATAWLLLAYAADVALFLVVEVRQVAPLGVVSVFNWVSAVVFFAVPGFLGNYWYWRKYRRVVDQVAADGLDRRAQLAAIKKRGRTNPVGAGLFIALFAVPVLWAGYWASQAVNSGYGFDDAGPLTVREVESNLLSNVDPEFIEERRACVLEEIREQAQAAGDPERLDPSEIEILPKDGWRDVGVFGRRLILAQAIVTKASFVCQRSPVQESEDPLP